MSNYDKKNTNLIQGTLIYAIGSFGTKLLAFLIIPLYTYYISTEDMGIYDILQTTVSLLTPIVTLQISDAAFRWMIRENERTDGYIRATLQVLFLNSVIASILILLVNNFMPFPYHIEFILLLISSRSLDTVQKLLRGVKNQWLFAISGIIYTLVFLVLNVYKICFLGQGVSSLFTSAIAANCLAVVMIFLTEKRLRVSLLVKPNGSLIKKMLRFSAPLVPNQLNWWVINSSDRYIVNLFLGSSANGIYALSYKFPSMLQLLLGFFNTSWQDVSIANSDLDLGEYYSGVFEKLYCLSFSLLWALVPFTKIFIMLIMSESYRISANYVPFLYLGTVFQSFSSFYGVGYLRDKNTKQASLTSIYGAIVNAVINIIFINFIGLYAASVSTFIGFFVMWIIREKQNRKELGIKINNKKFSLYFLSALLICSVTCISNMYTDLLLSLTGFIAFVLMNKKAAKNMVNKMNMIIFK